MKKSIVYWSPCLTKVGTMKSMCYPNPYVESEVFEAPNNNKYKFKLF